MSVNRNEIVIFEPGGRKQSHKIRSLIPEQCVDAVRTILGEEAAKKAQATMKNMERNGLEFLQIRHGDRRIRFYQTEIA